MDEREVHTPLKNILIIASLYGSKRVLGLARYLPEFGWSPTIITPPVSWQPTIISSSKPEIDGVRIIETGYGSLKDPLLRVGQRLNRAPNRIMGKLLHFGGAILNYPDSYSGWRKFALQAAITEIENNNVQAIMSICPVTSHIVAGKLKERYGVLWVADFPDLWSQNYNYSYGPIRRMMDHNLEKKTMRNVDIITTPTPKIDRLGKLHRNKPIHTITLGYNHEEYAVEVATTKKFTITYTGLIYAGKQYPQKVLHALSDLIRRRFISRSDCEVRFYGPYMDWLSTYVNELGLSDIVQQYATVCHEAIVKIQKESQVLLLLDWDDLREYGAYTAKVFEYIGANRPVLATGGMHGNAISDLLKQTNAGVHATSYEEICRGLLQYYREYKQEGLVVSRGTLRNQYSYYEMARKYDLLLSGKPLN